MSSDRPGEQSTLVIAGITLLIQLEAEERERRAAACCGDCDYCNQEHGGAVALRRMLDVLDSKVPLLSAGD
jgi:hypothetical protein